MLLRDMGQGVQFNFQHTGAGDSFLKNGSLISFMRYLRIRSMIKTEKKFY